MYTINNKTMVLMVRPIPVGDSAPSEIQIVY